MSTHSRGGRALSSLARGCYLLLHLLLVSSLIPSLGSARQSQICPGCHHLQTRSYAVAAPVLKPLDGPPIIDPVVAEMPPVSPTSTSADEFKNYSALILSRPALLTAAPSPFETAFYHYQRRLNERLALPFSRYFYFKPRSPAAAAFKAEVRERSGVVGRDVAGYQAYGDEGWNDEVLLSKADATSELAVRQELVAGDRTLATEEMETSEVDELPEDATPEMRRHAEEAAALEAQRRAEREAQRLKERQQLIKIDRKADGDADETRRAIDRKMDETIYFVIQDGVGNWQFPRVELEGRENLSQVCPRHLLSASTNPLSGRAPHNLNALPQHQQLAHWQHSCRAPHYPALHQPRDIRLQRQQSRSSRLQGRYFPHHLHHPRPSHILYARSHPRGPD